MSEEKPRMKVEYVKVVDSIFHLQPDLLAGELYTQHFNGQWEGVSSESLFARLFDMGQLYRKVETEIKTEKRWIVYDENGSYAGRHNENPSLKYPDNYQLFEIEVNV